MAAELVRRLRPAVAAVVGDNDRRFDERLGRWRWPGMDGARSVAAGIRAAGACRDVRVVMPPAGLKDARDWLAAGYGAGDVLARVNGAIGANPDPGRRAMCGAV